MRPNAKGLSEATFLEAVSKVIAATRFDRYSVGLVEDRGASRLVQDSSENDARFGRPALDSDPWDEMLVK